ncbi:MAG TPA: protein kinase [Lacipirellula sp.]
MSSCPTCQHEIDDAARSAGRCPACGAVLRALPQRTIADVRFVANGNGDPDNEVTLELPTNDDTARHALDQETLASLELSSVDDIQMTQPRTVAFSGESTVEFLGGSSAIDESMLTSHWEGNLQGPAPTDSKATIKQRETVTGSFVSSSSLIVKSRNVRPTGVVTLPTTSPADAPDYELLNIIGEGGMGVVYAARQSSIARTVALKMLKGDDTSNHHQRDKFISEAVVTGELDHPNIVPIYDLGANNDGALFYSMKRVKGTPWNKVIKERSLDENLTILLRVADAVAFAHVNGVIHRDLKPENVMLGDFGEVLVMDWGLARVSPEFPNAASVSQSDAMGGTPAYMAPEMATGPLEKITTASDVYLLGAILYEIITGRPPHSGKTVMACLFAAAKNKIEPAGRADELVEIALKAMATEPEDRHASVPAFQRAVREYQSHSQSIQLVESAQQHLKQAGERGDYELYARALYGLEEALVLWPGNRRAAALLATARLDYARLALKKGDFDLGTSLLDAERDEHRDVLAQLETGRRERESRKRRIRLLKSAVAALVVAVIAVVSVAYAAVRQQRDVAVAEYERAESEKSRAVAAEADAVANAEEAKQNAVIAQNNAAEAARNAEEARLQEQKANQNAEQARAAEADAKANERLAREQEARAKEAEQDALTAKAAEEYGAYIARIGLTKAKIDENSFDRAAELLAQCPPELRNWEWGRLEYLCNLSDETWQGAAPFDAAAFSPDGVHFATGDWEGKAVIWNRRTGEREHQMRQGQYVHAVAYDPTGKRLAAGGSDGSVHIYRAADGELIAKLDGHTDAVLSVRFSRDGRWLLSSGYDNTARLWNLATGKTQQVLLGHSWWVWSAEFSPDGKQLVTAGQDGKAIVWRPCTEEERRENPKLRPGDFVRGLEFTRHRGPVYAAKFSPSGERIATAGYDGRVLLWPPVEQLGANLERRLDGEPDPAGNVVELLGHRGPVRTLAFSPDGKSLATGGQDNVATVWNLATGEPVNQLRGHASHVRACSFSPDGKLLLTAGRDGRVKLWDPKMNAEARQFTVESGGLPEAVLSARFSRDGSKIVTAGRDRTASLWDARSLERLQWFREGHDFLVSSAVFFPDGTRLATGAGDGTVRVWDVASGGEILKLDGTGYLSALDIAEDGKLIATGGADNAAQIWDAASGEKLATLSGHEAEVSAVRFAPGGRVLATGDYRGVCRLWRYDPATEKWTGGEWLRGHSRQITAMEFVDGGARLVTSSGDNTCGQWNVTTGREIAGGILKHPNWVADVAVSEDGRLALTCCDDGKLRVWSLAEARQLRTIESRKAGTAFSSIDMSRDGRYIAAACAADGTVRVWNLATGEELGGDNGAGRTRSWLDLGDGGGLVWAARFAPAGDQLLSIGGNDARLYDVATRELVVRFSPHGVVNSADISPDGARVVTGSWDRSAKVWDVATGNVLLKLDGVHEGYVNSACFSPDGSRILTASDDGTVRLWNAADGKPLDPVLRPHNGAIRQACFSTDGTRMLTAGSDKTAKIIDAATGKTLHTLAGHKWAVRCCAFAAEAPLAITGSDDNTAAVWDVVTGERLQTLAGHTGAITSVALSPDGTRAVTGSEDNAAKLWDARTGKEILTLDGHSEEVASACFSPDGQSVLTSGRDGRVLLWPAVDWENAAAQAAQHAALR